MEKEKRGRFPKRKTLMIGGLTLIVVIGVAIAIGVIKGGEKVVDFEEISEKNLPGEIANDVIPEYKTLERALACVVDDDIYVVVTRGEKPTSGFHVTVDKMAIEDNDGKTNLIVYALFEDPDKQTPISQIITYPISVVKTDLTELPNGIELRIQY